MTSLYIVEQEEIARLGLKIVLSEDPDFSVVGDQDNLDSAFAEIIQKQPDVVITALRFNMETHGPELTRKIKEALPNVRVVVFTSCGDDQSLFDSLQAGADAYIMKGSSIRTLTQAVKSVSYGAAWLDPFIARRVFDAALDHASIRKMETPVSESENRHQPLSPREFEVLNLICLGMNNHQIAEKLVVTIDTVKTHVKHIMDKMDVASRTQVAVKAIKSGLIKDNDDQRRKPASTC